MLGFWLGILFLLVLDRTIPHLHQNSSQPEGPHTRLNRSTMLVRENAAYQSLSRGEIPSTHIKTPVRYLILQGKYPHKENGVETSEYSKMYNKERYKFFLDAPFEISDHCCSIMKKAPMHNYAKKTGKMPMTAQK